MEKPPTFSVCIPVYNGEKTIERAIKSVLAQTYKDYEFIICDNASTDKTEDIVKKYVPSGIKYYKNEINLGMAGNWNKCIELTKGDWIYLLHDDDEALPDMLFDVYQTITKYDGENIGMIFGKVNVIDETTSKTTIIKYPFDKDTLLEKHELIEHISKGNFIFCPGVVVSKEIYKKLKFIDNNLILDYIMWINISKIFKVLFINKIIANYHFNDDSMANSHKERMFFDTITAVKEFQKDKDLLIYFDNFNIYKKNAYYGLSIYYFKHGEIDKSKKALRDSESIKNNSNSYRRGALKLKIAILIQFISYRLALKFLDHSFHFRKK